MNYLLNVDWLEFRGRTEIHLNNFLSNGIYKITNSLILERLKDYGYQKQTYPFCFKIFYQDDNLGFIYTKSLNPALDSGLNVLVKIDNCALYLPDLTSTLKTLLGTLGLTEIKIVRLDICYDTDEDVVSRFKKYYYDPTKKFKNRNKINVASTGRDDKTITIGSLKGREKCISIYNKTLEINKSHKEYIRNIHRKVLGFCNIYRIEIKLMNKLIDLKNINILYVGNKEYIETIFNTYFNTIIDFVDINTNEKIDFITINNTGKKLDRIKRTKNKVGGKQEKAYINFMDKEIKTNEFKGNIKAWNQIRSILIKKYGLENWHNVKK